MTVPILEACDVDKRYGGVHALRGVWLGFERGMIHGLVGENGAGKSTLGKILSGAVPAAERRHGCLRRRAGRLPQAP